MKNKRLKKMDEHKFGKKLGSETYHHIKPRSRGGESIGSNLLRLDGYRHLAWHLLFKNLTLDEVIKLLQRIQHIKESQRFNSIIKLHY